MGDDHDIRRQFEEAIAGAELDDLRGLAPLPGPFGSVSRQVLRKPRREPVRYRVTVDLNDADPRIWRTLDLRSDLSLDVVHTVLQGAFGWADVHLYRFSLGGRPFDPESQLFLCPFDVEDGDADGVPVEQVHLDETLREPGDVLHYVYDFGDHWDLTVRLEAVLPLDSATARCVDGRRTAPPENSGGLRRARDVAPFLPDPERIDLDEINATLIDPLARLHDEGVNPALVKILQRLRFTPVAERLVPLALGLCEHGPDFHPDEFDAALRPVLWFLRRAQGEGMPLTPQGRLKQEDVLAAGEVVPGSKDRIRTDSRGPWAVQRFREMMQSVGLLRKYRGRLVATQAGVRGLVDHGFLWGHIASRLVPGPKQPRREREASLIVLLCATSPDGQMPPGLLVDTMRELGWVCGDGAGSGPSDVLSAIRAWGVFENLELLVRPGSGPVRVSSVGRALALETLMWGQ